MARVKVSFTQRFADSRRILREAFAFVGNHRDLMVFPFLGMILTFAFIVAPLVYVMTARPEWLIGWAGEHLAESPWLAALGIFLIFPLTYPISVLAAMLNAALAYAAYERMDGNECSLGDAWARAKEMAGPIARWTLVAMLVGGILAVIGQLLDRLRLVPWLGQVVQAIGAFAFAAATFFVIPIMVVQKERQATEAVKESVSMARDQWGKSVAGMVTIGLAVMVPVMIFMFLMMPIPILFALGGSFVTSLIIWGATMFLVVIVMVTIMGALQVVYQVGLYRYAKGLEGGPFTERTLVEPWKPYQG